MLKNRDTMLEVAFPLEFHEISLTALSLSLCIAAWTAWVWRPGRHSGSSLAGAQKLSEEHSPVFDEVSEPFA